MVKRSDKRGLSVNGLIIGLAVGVLIIALAAYAFSYIGEEGEKIGQITPDSSQYIASGCQLAVGVGGDLVESYCYKFYDFKTDLGERYGTCEYLIKTFNLAVTNTESMAGKCNYGVGSVLAPAQDSTIYLRILDECVNKGKNLKALINGQPCSRWCKDYASTYTPIAGENAGTPVILTKDCGKKKQ